MQHPPGFFCCESETRSIVGPRLAWDPVAARRNRRLQRLGQDAAVVALDLGANIRGISGVVVGSDADTGAYVRPALDIPVRILDTRAALPIAHVHEPALVA